MSEPARRVLIVPAAGVGSRLGADRPKLLVPVAGRPMIDRLLDLYAPWVSRAILVVHPSALDGVRAHCRTTPIPVDYDVQPAPTGMLDAVLIPHSHVAALRPTHVWITWCDQVAVHPRTVEELARRSERSPAGLVLPTVQGPRPYTHLQRDAAGRITAVLHQREGDAIPATGESEMGLFSLSAAAYLERLPLWARQETGAGASTRERNFLPFIPVMAAGDGVETFPAHEAIEAVGVNTPDDLARVEAHLRGRPPRVSGRPQ